MATIFQRFSKGCLACTQRQLIILRGKKTKRTTHARKPKPWNVRVMQSITRPIFIENYVPQSERCLNIQKSLVTEEKDEYEEYVYRGMVETFKENKMMIICQILSMTAEEKHKIRNKILDNDMKILYYNNKLMRRAVTELSQYQNMEPWLISRNAFIVSAEPKVKEVLKLLKKTPELIVIGGLVEDKLYSRNGLTWYSQLPVIEQLRGELVSVLNLAAGGRTHSILGSHQQNLCRNLDQYIKQKSEEES